MSNRPEVVIVQARCSQSKQGFGIRFEHRDGNEWYGTWAFELGDEVASREGYSSSRITGTFSMEDEWPGCPRCNNDSIFRCSCGKVACMAQGTRHIVCPWCDRKGEIKGAIKSLDAGADR